MIGDAFAVVIAAVAVVLAGKLDAFVPLVVVFEVVAAVVAVLGFVAVSAGSTSSAEVIVARATRAMISRNCYWC